MAIVLIAVLIMFYIHDTREKDKEIKELKAKIELLTTELELKERENKNG